MGTSIGREKTADLAFKTMIGLTPNANFDEAAEYMSNLAKTEYASEPAVYDATVLAWKSVGLPQNTITTSSVVNAIVSPKDITAVAYLKPYYSVYDVRPDDNYYTINIQAFLNNSPEFNSEDNISIITDRYSKNTRPVLTSLSNDRMAVIYQRKIDDSFYMWTGVNDDEVLIDNEGNVAGLDTSSDGSIVAISITGTNAIITNDSSGIVEHRVILPSTAENLPGKPVTYIDVVRFDPTGRYVVFDFFICAIGETDCSTFVNGNWSIGILDVATGSIEFPFPSQPERFDVGFPAFSNLTDRYLAFDVVEYTEDEGVNSGVYIYDRRTGDIAGITSTDFATEKEGAFGYPSFSADDSSIVVSVTFDDYQGMYNVLLDDYKLKDVETPLSLLNPSVSFKSYAAALAASSNVPSLSLSTSFLDFGDVIRDGDKSLQLCLQNKGSFPIDVYNSTLPIGFKWDGDNRIISEGESVCSPVVVSSALRELGSFDTTFSISHNGANSPMPVSLSGIIDIDTDLDGIANNKDTDDDGDGIEDLSDAFPLDATETIDTDSDGIGNNADTDDDGDQVADTADAFPLDGSESLDTDSDGIGNNGDTDDDGDGVEDNADAFPQNALYSADSDSDRMPDAWETKYGLDPNDASDATSDQDNDGVVALDEFLAGTIPAGSLDIDGNGQYDALTDGLLLLRGMFLLSGDALISDAVASDAAYKTSDEVASRIEMLGDLVDIDGNGNIDALTDGLVILRYLFNLRGDVLINDVIASDATVKTAEDVEASISILILDE